MNLFDAILRGANPSGGLLDFIRVGRRQQPTPCWDTANFAKVGPGELKRPPEVDSMAWGGGLSKEGGGEVEVASGLTLREELCGRGSVFCVGSPGVFALSCARLCLTLFFSLTH